MHSLFFNLFLIVPALLRYNWHVSVLGCVFRVGVLLHSYGPDLGLLSGGFCSLTMGSQAHWESVLPAPGSACFPAGGKLGCFWYKALFLASSLASITLKKTTHVLSVSFAPRRGGSGPKRNLNLCSLLLVVWWGNKNVLLQAFYTYTGLQSLPLKTVGTGECANPGECVEHRVLHEYPLSWWKVIWYLLLSSSLATLSPTLSDSRNKMRRTSLVIQWLWLWVPNIGGLGSVSGQGT